MAVEGQSDSGELMRRAFEQHLVIPAFNIPYLPMMAPVVRALRDTGCFGLIAVARLEWEKFAAGSLEAVYAEYQRVKDERFTRLHLDHVPVIDEDGLEVDYLDILSKAVQLGYQSVMVDGSRLPLAENIAATRQVVEMAHAGGVPVEGELGAVLGHEAGPLPPYEELFASGKGFTAPEEARRFLVETGVDWLSVSLGNVHGAIAKAKRMEKKVEARLHIGQLERIVTLIGIPLVLHGGSGIRQKYILEAVEHGIAKINVGTTIRQAYTAGLAKSEAAGDKAVYEATVRVIRDELEMADSAAKLNP